MKNISMLIWLTQLGLSVAAPLCGFVLLAVWLQNSLGWGSWVLWVGIGMGFISAAQGFTNSVRIMKRQVDGKKEDSPVSFNDHE